MPLVHFPKIFHSRSMVKRLHKTPGHVSAWPGNGTGIRLKHRKSERIRKRNELARPGPLVPGKTAIR